MALQFVNSSHLFFGDLSPITAPPAGLQFVHPHKANASGVSIMTLMKMSPKRVSFETMPNVINMLLQSISESPSGPRSLGSPDNACYGERCWEGPHI